MKQKHPIMKSVVFILLFALILLAGCKESPGPDLPLTTDVIDISHNGPSGFTLGNGPGATVEMKRYQTFIATSYPVVTAVEVKIRKIGAGTTYTPVLVELYTTNADGTPDERLAYGLINPDWTTYPAWTVVRTGLNYSGLVAGKEYAIVLSQGVLNSACYEWLALEKVKSELHFGKYQVDAGGWYDESGNGDGWLKVYVASKVTRPTRIFMYAATAIHNGNLKGSYPDARTGADFIAAYRPLSLAGKTTHAFISISSTDSIANMPARFGFPNNIPIVGVMDETKIIADNWGDLLDGSIKMSFNDALGLPDLDSWWSGSNSDGTWYDDVGSSDNCSGWTDSAKDGMTGVTNEVEAEWIHFNNGIGAYERWVLGIAY